MTFPMAPRGSDKQGKGLSSSGVQILPDMAALPCCDTGAPQDDPAPFQRPGYTLMPWVKTFFTTPVGPVPQVHDRRSPKEKWTTALARCGINRYGFTVSPGLYAVGEPDPESPVLVTANFKLTFDQVREAMAGRNAWILVLDTRGINVWCAAGKGTFATHEVVRQIQACQLAQVVSHRRLILPQLGATGVSAGEVKRQSGFRVIYGPIRCTDIPAFLDNKSKATPEMRQVTFTLGERLILTPVEVQITLKPALITALLLILLSGIGPGIFSISAAIERGGMAMAAMVAGILSGAVATPALLPHIPVREFALKGIITGAVAALILIPMMPLGTLGFAGGNALFWFTIAISSFLAMNFTGTTPFTSPSGVEKEMKRYMPFQLAGLVLAAGSWIYAAF